MYTPTHTNVLFLTDLSEIHLFSHTAHTAHTHRISSFDPRKQDIFLRTVRAK